MSNIPSEFLGRDTRRMGDLAAALGMKWEQFQKHINFDRCVPGCTECVAGCKRGAKWTGRVPADAAVNLGATLLTHVTVQDVRMENGVSCFQSAGQNPG